jgi:hypothetical protein
VIALPTCPFSRTVARDHVDLERIGVNAGAGQFLNRQIDLIGDEKIEAEDVVRRLPGTPAVDPLAAPQLVPLPRLPDRQADQKRDQRGEKRGIVAHVCRTRAPAPAVDSPE